MGIIKHKDIFSSKWITAEITDASNRIYYVPIKRTIGDYFLADIENHVYCFKIEGARIKVYQHTLVKSFRILQYDLSHYMPVSASDNKMLEEVLKQNGLPKMDMMLFNILKMLGKREKETKEFTPHNLQKLVNEVSKHEKDYKERVESIKNYLSHLNVTEIITPVRKITEFIEGDLLATDSKFMGSIVTQHARTDIEHKKVTNTPEAGKTAWLKMILIIAMVVIIALVIYLAYDSGIFNNLIPSFPSFNVPSLTPPNQQQSLMDRYPTPEAAKAAIDRGELDYDSLSNDEKAMIDTVELPKVENG